MWGVIPSDWYVEKLSRIVRADSPICYGILMPGENCSGGVPVIKVRDIKGGRIDQSDLLLTHPTIDNAYRRSRLQHGDMRIHTIRGTTGRVAIVPTELDGGNITQDTVRGRVNKSFSNRFLFIVPLVSSSSDTNMPSNNRSSC